MADRQPTHKWWLRNDQITVIWLFFSGWLVVVFATTASWHSDWGPLTDSVAQLPPLQININQASVAELTLLPGIGPTLAKRIVDRRQEIGSFQSVHDLLEIQGVGPRTFAGLRRMATVD